MRLRTRERSGGAYFLAQKDAEFIPSGCATLDCVLGGGWALSRVANIVGDKSTGKTLLAMEACINFKKLFPKGRVRVCEPEAALSKTYAMELGVPVGSIEFTDDDADIDTVEDWYDDLEEFADELGEDEPGLYVLDSLDALSSEDEKKRKIRESSYNMGKAKQMSALFRRLIRIIKKKRIAVIIISQVRDNIGVTFGEKHTRSGGKALDFHASQILWLAQMSKMQKVINKVTRTVGVQIKAYCKKNKVGLPFRECNLDLRYGYGMDDVASNAKYLASVGKAGMVQIGLAPDKINRFLSDMEHKSPLEFKKIRDRLDRSVREVWKEVEQAFLPTRQKY